MIEITDDESLKKENIKIEKSKSDFFKAFEKINSLKELIENEIDKINNLYDKTYSEVTKAFELRHEKLVKKEEEMKEELQNKVTKTKEKLEDFLTETNKVIKAYEKLNKGLKFWEKEENKNVIRDFSYISKINFNLKDSNPIFVALMKNLDIKYKKEEENIKYEEYFFNVFQISKNIQIKDIKPYSAKIIWEMVDININKMDKNKLKYIIKIRNKTKEEKFKQIYEGRETELLINNLKKSSNYEIAIYSIYEFLISPVIYKSFETIKVDSNILAESMRQEEFLDKIYEWIKYSKLDLLYRGTRDGASSEVFHEKCDNKGPTLCLYKNEVGNIFGGYASIPWKKEGGTQSAKGSFIFTLTNIFEIEPTKFIDKNTNKNVHHAPDYGPSFGEHNSDISVYSNFLRKNVSSNFPEQYYDTTGKGKCIFTGNNNSEKNEFKIKEIEVFKIS